jgi:tetratricopeptide (TPR) repeat protein
MEHNNELSTLDNNQDTLFNVPYPSLDGGMTGRDRELEELRHILKESRLAAITAPEGANESDGTGKTRLAVQYAYQNISAYPGGVFWFHAHLPMNMQLVHLSYSAGWVHPETEYGDAFEKAVKTIKFLKNGLVVFDNIENKGDIEPYIVEWQKGPHIICTGNEDAGNIKNISRLELSPMDENSGLQLLSDASGKSVASLSESERSSAPAIIERCNNLPLCIEMVGAFLKLNPELSIESLHETIDGSEAGNGMPVVLEILKPLLDTEPVLTELVDLLAWSGPSFMGAHIPAELLQKSESDLAQAFQKGQELRLLQGDVYGERFTVHSLLRKAWREAFPKSGREQWFNDVAKRCGDWFEERRKPTTGLEEFVVDYHHLKDWMENTGSIDALESARLLWLQAYPPYFLGNYKDSLKKVEDAFTVLENDKTSDASPELKANMLNDIGSIHGAMGNHEKSLEYHHQALDMQKEHLGDDHPDTINSIENVGTTYSVLENHQESLKYHTLAYEVKKKKFGEQDPETAGSLDNIGSAHEELKNYDDAVTFHKLALEIRREELGEYHQETSISFFNIVYTMTKLKQYLEASEMLTGYLAQMPQDHPEYERFLNLKKFINKEQRKGSLKIPSKKKKKKKKK